ncbi:serine hydrolase [Neisseria musculi]|uniref:D-alanyl-D-alanine carboxypeptidase family protein n=1 Tax=Neisseria musculi TaxID=1815583 RepID=A0A7H1MAE7_9NEIS|nr:serine hydrolase [Neisseria musculi]QNT58612.1 D-alanyl-D-alanine carboxypeptidase family protein [Neisseria musculi]
MNFTKKIAAVCLSIGLAAFSVPAVSNDLDVLGQFLEQNFPIDSDPIGAFASMNAAEQVEAQAAYAGPLLASQSALIVNNRTGEVLFQKNPNRVMPIASISKLMSAIVVLDADQNMSEHITITEAEIDRLKGTGSRLTIGTTLTRAEMLHLSLMSSENRATHALGRSYPGGMSAFVNAMNRKAQSLGMVDTRFYEPTGLDFRNVSTANDLNKLVQAASKYPVIRRNSTSNHRSVYTNRGQASYKNSNSLVREGSWNIELQKTGYIREAGRSMVVRANVQNQPVTIVLLNAPSSLSRVNDARKIESWMLQRRS